MDNKLISKIDKLIEEYEEKLIADVVTLVNINSEQGEALEGAPFGKGPRKVLDTVMEMAEEEGFCTKDYGVGVVSVAMDDTKPDLGIWAHGDVVPEGEGWNYPPYDATIYKGCIIGRGATDNKGQLAAVYNLFRIFKNLEIKLNYNPALYVGSNEETGMRDMIGIEGNPDAKGFLNVCEFPKMSLVPDSGFPVGYGARGLTTFKMKSRTKLHGFTFIAGQNDAPGLAKAEFDTINIPDEISGCVVKKGNKNCTEAFSQPRHTANPDPEGNMITKLSQALLNCDILSAEDRYILEFFRDVSLDIGGKMLGIYTESELMKPTTVFAQKVDFVDGYCELTVKVRYPVEITYEEMEERLKKICDIKGFDISGERGHKPYVNDKDMEMAKTLADIANSITGDNKDPYIVGSTYAHYLPNAYVYGMNGSNPPDVFPDGYGGAHGIDESVSVKRLKRAMRIYARALLKLNEMNWYK